MRASVEGKVLPPGAMALFRAHDKTLRLLGVRRIRCTVLTRRQPQTGTRKGIGSLEFQSLDCGFASHKMAHPEGLEPPTF